MFSQVGKVALYLVETLCLSPLLIPTQLVISEYDNYSYALVSDLHRLPFVDDSLSFRPICLFTLLSKPYRSIILECDTAKIRIISV